MFFLVFFLDFVSNEQRRLLPLNRSFFDLRLEFGLLGWGARGLGCLIVIFGLHFTGLYVVLAR